MNDRLEFGCDENNPKEWFLHKTTDKRGFPLQFNRGGTRLRNKYICKTILDIAKVKESATFLVSKDPVKTELGPFYRTNTFLPHSPEEPSPNYKPITSVVCPMGESLRTDCGATDTFYSTITPFLPFRLFPYYTPAFPTP